MIQRLHTGPRMSQASIHGNVVYLAGQVADDTSADVTGQTVQVLAAIDRLLAEAGTDKTRILTATVYLADINTFAQMNRAWDVWVPQGLTPARATVEARLAAPEYKVEIQVIAALQDTPAREARAPRRSPGRGRPLEPSAASPKKRPAKLRKPATKTTRAEGRTGRKVAGERRRARR